MLYLVSSLHEIVLIKFAGNGSAGGAAIPFYLKLNKIILNKIIKTQKMNECHDHYFSLVIM